jgi:hypothetical protein
MICSDYAAGVAGMQRFFRTNPNGYSAEVAFNLDAAEGDAPAGSALVDLCE